MPEMDGHAALKEIRSLEKAVDGERAGSTRIIITTALRGRVHDMDAAREGATYLPRMQILQRTGSAAPRYPWHCSATAER